MSPEIENIFYFSEDPSVERKITSSKNYYPRIGPGWLKVHKTWIKPEKTYFYVQWGEFRGGKPTRYFFPIFGEIFIWKITEVLLNCYIY